LNREFRRFCPGKRCSAAQILSESVARPANSRGGNNREFASAQTGIKSVEPGIAARILATAPKRATAKSNSQTKHVGKMR
jgi:hypothetical protein